MKFSSSIQNFGRRKSIPAAAQVLTLLMLLAPAMLGADDRPVIGVKFSINGEESIDIDPESLKDIQENVENLISTRAEKRWGFLNWTRSSPATQEAAQWLVTLKVEEIPVTTDNGGTTTGYIGTLQHSGQLGAETLEFDQTEENETIYPIGSYIPFKEATPLGSDLSRQLDKQLETLFQSMEVEGYLRQIPIVDEVIADAANSRVLVPIKMQDLQTGGDSVLAVIFLHDNNRGQLDLETAGEVSEEGQHNGYVIGRVKDLKLFPITIDTPTWWDDKLFAVIDSAEEVKVYMLSYSPSLSGGLNADNGLISEPDL